MTLVDALEATADEIRLDSVGNGRADSQEAVAVNEQIASAFEALAARLAI